MRLWLTVVWIAAAASCAAGQWVTLGDWRINAETLEVREAGTMVATAQGTGIIGGSYEAARVASSYSAQRMTFLLESNSNGKRNKAGDNRGIGASLHGDGTRTAVNQWGWVKSFGENPNISDGQIQSLNNAPQFAFKSRSRAIGGYGTNTFLFREDIADVYGDLGITDDDLQYCLAAIGSEWSADYFADNILRDGASTGTPGHRWGLLVEKSRPGCQECRNCLSKW